MNIGEKKNYAASSTLRAIEKSSRKKWISKPSQDQERDGRLGRRMELEHTREKGGKRKEDHTESILRGDRERRAPRLFPEGREKSEKENINNFMQSVHGGKKKRKNPIPQEKQSGKGEILSPTRNRKKRPKK